MNRTITINPDTQRIELMGRWTGFGFSPPQRVALDT